MNANVGQPAAACPFCGGVAAAATGDALCDECGRDRTAPRRICKQCKNLTPIAEPACHNCGMVKSSELRWKIPLIVAMFAAALTAAVLIRLT